MDTPSLYVVLFLVKGDCLLVQIYHLKFFLTSRDEGKEGKRSFVLCKKGGIYFYTYMLYKCLFIQGLPWKGMKKTAIIGG